jgi:hypothetical protein
MNTLYHRLVTTTALVLATGTACAQATIDHNKALAGGITPGDAAGYPVTLSVPGHYKLMGNLSVPAGTKGIDITARGVTLDLNGFTVAGTNLCTQNQATRAVTCTAPDDHKTNGISTTLSQGVEPIVIRNGTVRGFASQGVLTSGNVRIDGINVMHNTDGGISGINDLLNTLHVSNVSAELNGGNGVTAYHGLLENVRATSNGADGITGTVGGAIAHNCLARRNRQAGLHWIAVGGSGTLDNGTNRQSIVSLGGNVDNGTPF